MALGERLICASTALADGGKGVCFAFERFGREVPAFVIRYRGAVHAYVNECGHVPVRLDWTAGEFFDDSGLYLICGVHGALYAPDTGRCLLGRCQGRGLRSLPVSEHDGSVFLCVGQQNEPTIP